MYCSSIEKWGASSMWKRRVTSAHTAAYPSGAAEAADVARRASTSAW